MHTEFDLQFKRNKFLFLQSIKKYKFSTISKPNFIMSESMSRWLNTVSYYMETKYVALYSTWRSNSMNGNLQKAKQIKDI